MWGLANQGLASGTGVYRMMVVVGAVRDKPGRYRGVVALGFSADALLVLSTGDSRECCRMSAIVAAEECHPFAERLTT